MFPGIFLLNAGFLIPICNPRFYQCHVPLFAARSSDHQANAADKRKRAEDGRYGQRVFLLVGKLYGAQINIFLFVGKADSAHGKSCNAQDDEDNSNECCSLHVFLFSWKVSSAVQNVHVPIIELFRLDAAFQLHR